MAIPEHPMRKLAGTPEAKTLMAQVSAHKTPRTATTVEERSTSGAASNTEVGVKPGDAANTAGADYADPGYRADKLKRYPLDTPEHVRAAASYFGMPKNKGKYTFAQQKTILSRIAAAKKHLNVSPETYGDVVSRYTNK